MAQTKEIVVQPNPAALLQIAIDGGADIDKLGKLMDMQFQWNADQAQKAYNADMVKAQSEMPIVATNKTNDQTHSRYADIEALAREAKPIYTKRGFSVSCYEDECPHEGMIRTSCDVMHRDGHTKKYYIDFEIDDKGLAGKTNKTKIHGKGSTFSYSRRYLVLMVFDIPTGDDNDGNKPKDKIKLITKKQTTDINTTWGKKLDKAEFQRRLEKKYGTSKLETLTTEQADELLKALNIIPDKSLTAKE